MCAPGLHVLRQINGRAVRMWQLVEVADIRTRRVAHDDAVSVAIGDAKDIVKAMSAFLCKSWQQFRKRQFTLADHDHVCAAREIFIGVVGRLGPAEHNGRTHPLADLNHVEHVELGHQVRVKADDGWTFFLHERKEVRFALKGRIEHANAETARFEIRRDIQNTERRVRLHDFQFVRVFAQEVAVSE
jgi:hypothetical protein